MTIFHCERCQPAGAPATLSTVRQPLMGRAQGRGERKVAVYSYKDLETGRIKHTKGHFAGWTRTGLIGARYAIFRNPSGDTLVPAYLLTAETRQALSGEKGK